nr:hypothetical protein [Paludisphaera rhizosphaerae]
MARCRGPLGSLAGAFDHFHKATRSYWAGLFRCCDVADLIVSDVSAWRDKRDRLGRRQAVRTSGRRFRRDPEPHPRSLEDSLIKRVLPP